MRSSAKYTNFPLYCIKRTKRLELTQVDLFDDDYKIYNKFIEPLKKILKFNKASIQNNRWTLHLHLVSKQSSIKWTFITVNELGVTLSWSQYRIVLFALNFPSFFLYLKWRSIRSTKYKKGFARGDLLRRSFFFMLTKIWSLKLNSNDLWIRPFERQWILWHLWHFLVPC